MKKCMLLTLMVSGISFAGSVEEMGYWDDVKKIINNKDERPDLKQLAEQISRREPEEDPRIAQKILCNDCHDRCCCGFGCCCPYSTEMFCEVVGKAVYGISKDEGSYAQQAARSYLASNILNLQGRPLAQHPEQRLLTGVYMKMNYISFEQKPRFIAPKKERIGFQKECLDDRYPCPPVSCLVCVLCTMPCCVPKHTALAIGCLASSFCAFPAALWHITAENLLSLQLKRSATESDDEHTG